MKHKFLRQSSCFALTLILPFTLIACTGDANTSPSIAGSEATQTQNINPTTSINDWFEARFEDELARSPLAQTSLGIKTQQDKLDDVSQIAMNETVALTQNWLEDMRASYDLNALNSQDALSYRLFEYASQDSLATHEFNSHDYVFQHMSGPHTNLPSFMINFHAVDNVEDAKAYIARLDAFKPHFDQYILRSHKQFEDRVRLPIWVYPKLIEASKNIIKGAPFDEDSPDFDGSDSPLYADIKGKINALDIDQGQKDDLIRDARKALERSVGSAYLALIQMFEIQEQYTSNSQDGVWKLPEGEKYYQSRLKHYTTTDLTAEEIHTIGLSEVARIHAEMEVIKEQVGFDGSLQDFFVHLRTDPQFTFPNTDEGRASYIAQATEIIDDMKDQLDGLFITKPKADVIVKRVEPFREASAFGAFYNQPAPDGSRPGTYYINLKDMGELPIFQLQALAYHEGIPGHHMQIAIAQELQGLPKFRTLGGHTAYIEGWALYSESVPAELNLYTDPYQDFGRLSMELFRAARLVLDTGIHSKQWSREEAVDYMLTNTANAEGDIRTEIDRYIVWPGQATAYKIGMIKIQELKAKAKEQLGNKFDIREFHDVILANGSVPLTILEELVDQWIAKTLN